MTDNKRYLVFGKITVSLVSKPKKIPCSCKCGNTHTTVEQQKTFFKMSFPRALYRAIDQANTYIAVNRDDTVTKNLSRFQKNIDRLKSNPERITRHLPKDERLGSYEQAISIIEQLREACIKNPGTVLVWKSGGTEIIEDKT